MKIVKTIYTVNYNYKYNIYYSAYRNFETAEEAFIFANNFINDDAFGERDFELKRYDFTKKNIFSKVTMTCTVLAKQYKE